MFLFKTNKSAKKRFKITGKKKLLRRLVNQNHFNAKDSGNQRRGKRGSKSLAPEFRKDIISVLQF